MANYYEILKIGPDSDIEAIKKAYRRLAREVHPDKSGSNSEAFRRINEAYGILSNPEKRAEYDKIIQPEKATRIYKYHLGIDLKISLKIKMNDLFLEKTKNIITTRKGLCNKCNGTGSQNKSLKICPNCQGKGVNAYALLRGYTKRCASCNGFGKIPEPPYCNMCNGKGLYPETIRKSIKLAPHHLFSRCIVITGFGNYCLGGSAGDLLIELNIEPDSRLKINGLNIESFLEISPAQAVLGDRIIFDVYGRKEEIIIPARTQNGHLLEKEGAGLHTGKKGNILLRVRIKIPEKITREQEKLYKQLLTLEK